MLILAAIISGVLRADAASLSIAWDAPTTNVDGTSLTDLGGYRLYFGSSLPACPATTFSTVPSPTTTPAPGQTVTTRLVGLTAGVTYFVRVTAVDSSGGEGPCSGATSGVAQPDFSVTPSTTTSFGTVATGTSVDRTFTVQNTSAASIAGGASVAAPFTIVSGGSFSLPAGASQIVTVRFQPTTAGTFAANVNFTAGGDTVSRSLSGSATASASVTLSVTKTGTGAGGVASSPAGIACGTTCTQSVAPGTQVTLTATANTGSTFGGWSGGGCSSSASCVVTVNQNTTVNARFDAAPASITLSISKNGTGAGTVTSSPVGISCGSACTQTVAAGTTITLTAGAASGSTFSGWSGACGGVGTCSLTMSSNTTVTATFDTSVQPAPVPGVSNLSPSSAVAGTAEVTVTVNGSGFVATSVARWDGTARTTTVVSASQLRFTLSASDLATPRSVPVSVFTPAPGGGTSGTAAFVITAPATGEIVIDNADPGVQDAAGGRTFTGRWCLSSATNGFGTNSLQSCGGGRDKYRWTPRIPASGSYDVYVWIAASPTRATRVPIVVLYAGGSTTRLFDERTGGGQWILHGRYPFNAGTGGYVETSDANGQAGADAVRLVPAAAPVPNPPPPDGGPSGLVAAYAFNEASGSTVTDVSGQSNVGTLGSGVTRAAQGRFGGALAFNGSALVTVPHSPSLNLTSSMTLEAWVFPTVTPTHWATILMKEQSGTFAYTLYSGSPTNRPSGQLNSGPTQSTEFGVPGPAALALNTWSHLAATYDGTMLRVYVNGVQVASAVFTGSIATSNGVLRFGGNNIWGEYFRGLIDEVRIYNRALAPAEIQADMNTPIGG